MDTSTPIAFADLNHFAGFDWASEKHDVAVVARDGSIVLQLEFADTAEGWSQLHEKLLPLGKVGVGIETSCGPEVERLLAMGAERLPHEPQGGRAVPRPQGPQRRQGRCAGRLELRRCPAHRWAGLAAVAAGG